MDEMIFISWDKIAEKFVDYKLDNVEESCYLLFTNNADVRELKCIPIIRIDKWDSQKGDFDRFVEMAKRRFENEVIIYNIDFARPIYIWASCKGEDFHLTPYSKK